MGLPLKLAYTSLRAQILLETAILNACGVRPVSQTYREDIADYLQRVDIRHGGKINKAGVDEDIGDIRKPCLMMKGLGPLCPVAVVASHHYETLDSSGDPHQG